MRTPNHSIQRTGASCFAQVVLVAEQAGWLRPLMLVVRQHYAPSQF
jgi:hypothetical protein